jgi:L-threonine kinase
VARPDRHVAGTGTGSACGSFGELLQGMLPESNLDFLVTLPIVRGSIASIQLTPEATELAVAPAGKCKALTLARRMLAQRGYHRGGHLRIESDLPVGKGLASSSADLVATARAVAAAFGIGAAVDEIEGLLREIEPSDGVMYPGAVAYHHREVRLHRILGDLPSLAVVGVDEGGEVDTIQFNRLPKPFTARDKQEYQRLLGEITGAIGAGDLVTIGRIATRSAEMNQRIRPKKHLAAMTRLGADIGALGVVAAHSGTMLGLLLARDEADYPDKLYRARRGCLRLTAAVSVDYVQ